MSTIIPSFLREVCHKHHGLLQSIMYCIRGGFVSVCLSLLYLPSYVNANPISLIVRTYNPWLYSYSGNAVVFRGYSTRTSTQIQREYNARLGRTTPVQRLYNGKYNVFNLIFKRVTMTRSYNACRHKH